MLKRSKGLTLMLFFGNKLEIKRISSNNIHLGAEDASFWNTQQQNYKFQYMLHKSWTLVGY